MQQPVKHKPTQTYMPVPPKRQLAKEIWKNRAVYTAISPFYLLFAVFGLFPIGFSLYLAFHKWDGIGEMTFNGFNNSSYMLTDPEFWQAVGNTFMIWIYSTIPMLFFALIVAFLLHAPFIRFKTFFRIGFFLPNVTSIVAVSIIFAALFANNYGILNYVMGVFNLPLVAWLDVPWGIKAALSSMVIWRWTGYNAVIYLAGLQSIPTTLYEAAKIDGATGIQSFFRITIPLLRPVILFTVITSTIGGMQLFTEPQILLGNNGGTGGAGMTIVLYLYRESFINNYFGYGATVGWGMFLIIALFSFINWKIVQGPSSK
ncbi:sugar ABC transporter permease [Paenibacillus polygoni]|uniref:Sugar ABC transporter permease n=2 Tax=Paenibacillus polygoni TaxID=3050112 RepID=A0ABY8X0P4_9BACL|nr:sugar ABC transporter permease [Paenibacillus polygoni]